MNDCPRIKVLYCDLKATKDITKKLSKGDFKWGWHCDHMLKVKPFHVMDYTNLDEMDEPDESYTGGQIQDELNTLGLLGVTGLVLTQFVDSLSMMHWIITETYIGYKRIEIDLDIDLKDFILIDIT